MHKTKGFKKRNKYHKKTRKHTKSRKHSKSNGCKNVSYEINRIQKLINTVKHKNIKLSRKNSNTKTNNTNDQ